MCRIDDNPRQPRRSSILIQAEIPSPVILRKKSPLQAIGQPRYRSRQRTQLLVEKGPQPLQLIGRGQILGCNLLVEGAGENAIAELLRIVQDGGVWPPGLVGLGRLLALDIRVQLIGIGKIGDVLRFTFLAFGKLLLGALLLALGASVASDC